MKMTHTPGPWKVDDGMIDMPTQAQLLIDNVGTDKKWIAIGIEDEEGFAEVVALAHPINAPLIAAAPKLLEACKYASELIKVARQYFPKSIKNSNTFQLESTNAAINSAIAKAEGTE